MFVYILMSLNLDVQLACFIFIKSVYIVLLKKMNCKTFRDIFQKIKLYAHKYFRLCYGILHCQLSQSMQPSNATAVYFDYYFVPAD